VITPCWEIGGNLLTRKSILFAGLAITLVFIAHLVSWSITPIFYNTYTYTRDPVYLYLPDMFYFLLLALSVSVLFDVYYFLYHKRLIAEKARWIQGVIVNYAVYIPLYAGLLLSYISIVEYIIRYHKEISMSLSRFTGYYALLLVFIATTYIGVAGVKYIVSHRSILTGRNPLEKLVLVLKMFWRSKGSFLIWIIFGFLVTGLLGLLVELLVVLPFTTMSYTRFVAVIATIVLDGVILYFYYTYFVKNYIEDLIMDTAGLGAGAK
jgi:hypothetical protein